MSQRICAQGHTFIGDDPCPVCMPHYRTFQVHAKVWLYPGDTAAWHFITIPSDTSHEIKRRFLGRTRGFGSLPVRATIGNVSWTTSIFPDKKRGGYLLPLKAAVREKTCVQNGDSIDISVHVTL